MTEFSTEETALFLRDAVTHEHTFKDYGDRILLYVKHLSAKEFDALDQHFKLLEVVSVENAVRVNLRKLKPNPNYGKPSKVLEDGRDNEIDEYDITNERLEEFEYFSSRLRDPALSALVHEELDKAISGEYTYTYPLTDKLVTIFCKELSKKEIKNLQLYFTICDTTVKGNDIVMKLEFHDFRESAGGIKLEVCKK